jgi:hypothetical protein
MTKFQVIYTRVSGVAGALKVDKNFKSVDTIDLPAKTEDEARSYINQNMRYMKIIEIKKIEK